MRILRLKYRNRSTISLNSLLPHASENNLLCVGKAHIVQTPEELCFRKTTSCVFDSQSSGDERNEMNGVCEIYEIVPQIIKIENTIMAVINISHFHMCAASACALNILRSSFPE